MKKQIIAILTVVLLLLIWASPALADTTADITVTFTPAHIEISDNVSSINFGTVADSGEAHTSTGHVGITNSCNIQTDITIEVTGDWTGGNTFTHDNTGTPGADTVGMLANRGGTWGVGDVIVETTAGSPNYIYEDCPSTTNFDYGLKLLAQTSSSDGVQKSNTVRITAAAG